MKTCIILICLVFSSLWSQTGNTISKNDFNFALQSGYLYSRTDNAYFKNRGAWSFETGFVSFYTEKVPRVTNPDWQERMFLQVPFGFEIFPSDNLALQINSDAIAEFPRHPVLHHSIGGNSPRFRTKIKLLDEKPYVPALALTVGVTFSSAKPFNIWTRRHNYDESNGLAGPGTGVADYLLLITASKHLTTRNFIHARCGVLFDDIDIIVHIMRQVDKFCFFINYLFVFEHIPVEKRVAMVCVRGVLCPLEHDRQIVGDENSRDYRLAFIETVERYAGQTFQLGQVNDFSDVHGAHVCQKGGVYTDIKGVTLQGLPEILRCVLKIKILAFKEHVGNGCFIWDVFDEVLCERDAGT